MKMTGWTRAVLAAMLIPLLFWLSGKVYGQEEHPALTSVKESVAELKALAGKEMPAEDMEEAIYALIKPRLDLPQFAKYIAGPGWHRMTPEQKEEFADLLLRLVVRLQAYAIKEIVNVGISYKTPAIDSSDDVHITMLLDIDPPNSPIDVRYVMREQDGEWKVVDIVVENVSMVITYRPQFAPHLRRGNPDDVINGLRRHLYPSDSAWR